MTRFLQRERWRLSTARCGRRAWGLRLGDGDGNALGFSDADKAGARKPGPEHPAGPRACRSSAGPPRFMLRSPAPVAPLLPRRGARAPGPRAPSPSRSPLPGTWVEPIREGTHRLDPRCRDLVRAFSGRRRSYSSRNARIRRARSSSRASGRDRPSATPDTTEAARGAVASAPRPHAPLRAGGILLARSSLCARPSRSRG